MANIARLGVVLGIDSAEFTKGMESAKKSVENFASDSIPKLKNAAAAAAVAVGALIYKSLQLSDQIADLSDATEISIANILSISNAIEMSGGKAESAGKAIEKFTENIDTAAKGTSKEMQDAFARVGITLQDLATKSNFELFAKATKNIAEMTDVAARSGARMDLFGKSLRGVDMGKMNELVQQGSEQYERYAIAISEAADLNDKLAQKSKQTALIFTLQVMPVLSKIFDTINTEGGLAEKVFEGLGNVIIWFSTKIAMASGGMQVLIEGIKGFSDLTWDNEKIAQIRKDTETFVAEMEKLYDRNKRTQAAAGDKDGTKPLRDVKGAKDPEAEKLKNMLAVAELLSVEFKRERDHSLDMLVIKEQMLGMTENERKVQEAVNSVLDATSKKIDDITKRKEEAAGRGADQQILDAYDKQIEKIKIIGDEYARMTKAHEEASIKDQQTFEFGWNKAFRQYAEDAENYATMAGDMFQAVTGAMSTAIDNFVESGKFSFKDFATSILKDLIKIELKMQAMQLFRFAVGAIGSSFGGATATPVDMGGAISMSALPAAAEGGTITGATLVGERGPELFIPGRSGTIIPNNNLSDVMGGGGITYNGPVIQNMQAIDTQSGLQFLAKNKMNIYALNQSASRSMPTSR